MGFRQARISFPDLQSAVVGAAHAGGASTGVQGRDASCPLLFAGDLQSQLHPMRFQAQPWLGRGCSAPFLPTRCGIAAGDCCSASCTGLPALCLPGPQEQQRGAWWASAPCCAKPWKGVTGRQIPHCELPRKYKQLLKIPSCCCSLGRAADSARCSGLREPQRCCGQRLGSRRPAGG